MYAGQLKLNHDGIDNRVLVNVTSENGRRKHVLVLEMCQRFAGDFAEPP